ncbi:MAG TPA: VIT family protein [Thermomicrobiales bacterium]|nr:VIT family protein [Thermomicrobiales bacterium]
MTEEVDKVDPTGSVAAMSPHKDDERAGSLGDRLNQLRAGVLGANDGIVSVAGVVVGVAGASAERTQILTAGVAALVAGALSMAGGEYVSVSTQRDTEIAAIAKESEELRTMPEAELDELAAYYQKRGISSETAHAFARELTAVDALRAHTEMEFNITPGELTSPWHAAYASLVAFAIGAVIPLLAIALPPDSLRIWVCVASVIVALFLTGYISARLGDAPKWPAIVRNVVVGMLTMGIAWAVGRLFGVATG